MNKCIKIIIIRRSIHWPSLRVCVTTNQARADLLMASCWRWYRQCRLQSPSKIASRNRSFIYAICLFPLLMTILLIPGGEIANYKYSGSTVKDAYVTTFRHHGDASDNVIRGARSLENKMIILWTSFFEFRTWRVTGDPFRSCAVSTCDLSLDRRKAPEADAILFNARGFHDRSQLPEHPPWQVWILHNSEPPYSIYVDLRLLNNVFNWTSWYRTDADIFSPYGDYVEKSNAFDEDSGEYFTMPNLASDDRNDNEDDEEDGEDPKQTNRTADDTDSDVYRLHDRVLFFAASNCQDRGRRYKKVAQLKKYLPIDEFGDCGQYQCPKDDEQCDRVFSRYQFVLAFENGYCRDYVTEKLWNAYRRLQIPIVSGGVDYEKVAIPGSYIDYDNFSTAEELSVYVHRVSTDPKLYNSYFAWRKHFDVVHSPVANWCQICEALHDKSRQPQVYKDLEGWVAQDSCPLYSYYQHFWTQIYLGMFKLFGI